MPVHSSLEGVARGGTLVTLQGSGFDALEPTLGADYPSLVACTFGRMRAPAVLANATHVICVSPKGSDNTAVGVTLSGDEFALKADMNVVPWSN